MRKRTGQGMAEYSLIAASVACLVLPALLFLGGNLNRSMQGMLPAPPLPKQDVGVASVPSQNPANAAALQSVQLIINGVDLSSSQNLAKEIQTAGANGATAILANRIEQIAQQKLDAGEISPEQYKTLIALANQGHSLGAMEKLVETAAANSSSAQAFMDQKLTFEGKDYSMADFAYQMGFTQAYSEGLLANPLGSANLANPAMKTFISLYDQAVASGALSDPATQAEVKKLASDIANINDSVLFALQDLGWGESITPTDFTASTATRIAGMDASTKTNQNAAGICTAGNGQDTGSQCSG